MPTASRLARPLAAACLVVATLLSVTAAPASALEPPRPLPGYRPAFVTETDQRPWRDCLWASGAMLLDKWTNGRVTVTHQRLRTLSGDRVRGSDLGDLKVAYAKLGIDLRFSPNGGERITWGGLLNRLAHGAGAVLLGDDHKLPRWYGRWDHGFWKAKGKKDNHAVYVERYDRRHGRVWLMDPLGRDGWKGEWISVSSLRRFVWSSGGALYAAVTPNAKPAPFAGVRVSGPAITRTANTLDMAWSLRAPRRWRYPGSDVSLAFRPARDPVLAAVASQAVVQRVGDGPALKRPSVSVSGHQLQLSASLPARPGAWTTTVRLTDRRFGRTVAGSDPVTVFVAGSRQATLRIHAPDRGIQAGTALDLSVSVANSGSLSWIGPPASLITAGKAAPRNTRLVARWIQVDDEGQVMAADSGGESPDPVVLGDVALAPGRRVDVDASILVPQGVGRWALAIDVVDDVDGSFAGLGSQPAVQVFDVVAARGIDSVD